MATAVERISLILRTSVSDLISKMETNPNLIDTAIADEKTRLAKLIDQSAVTFGDEKMKKRDYEAIIKKADDAHESAAKALKAGNEDDAKALLTLEQDYRKKAEIAKITYNAVKQSADVIRQRLNEAKDNIKQMEDKASEIKAKMQATKAIDNANKLASSAKAVGSESDFRRFEAKADADYNAALGKAEYIDAMKEDKQEDLVAKYNDNSGDDIDDALAALKAEVNK